MCGIAGKLYLSPKEKITRVEIEAMMRPINHRGPDGQGVYLNGPVGLGHLRLAIIDIDGGPQPMTNEDGTIWIVFNGEIYNFQSLREELVTLGHKFKSRSDTEVIVHAYEEYGTNCVSHLQGMFAFAIWDQTKQRLFVARDRIGIKPLYYCETPTSFYFASEFKAIISDQSISRDIKAASLRQFFSFYYLPGEDTLFKEIRKLAPGHHLIVENGKITIQQYWDLQFNRSRADRSFDQVVEELYELLDSTVREHMISDVPVGVLLSGGVDSSAILSLAVNNTTQKVKTFTLGFDGGQVVDERPFARLAAERFGTEHYDLSITPEDFWDFLPEYVWHMEEPVCEPPAIALHYISKLARQHVKVLLSGEGGDEAFAGYSTYPNTILLNKIAQKLGLLSGIAGGAASLTGTLLGMARVQSYGFALGRPLSDYYFSRRSSPTNFFNKNRNSFFSADFNAISSSASEYMEKVLEPTKGWPLLDQMLYADTKTWLPDDLLVKADRMTMANSLELRVPLLDHKLLEFAASLPQEYKVQGRETKRALKAAFARILPSEILTRKKAGFPVPYGNWLRGPLASRVKELLLSDTANRRGYFQHGQVEKLLRENQPTGAYSTEIFSLIVIELWHRRFNERDTIFPSK